jgi:hypothetical protein
MIKEFDKFKSEIGTIDGKIKTLASEIEKNQGLKEAAQAKYKGMVLDEKFTLVDLNKAKDQIDELSRSILIAEERLNILEKNKTDKQAELLASARKGWDREAAALKNEVDAIFSEAREYRAKLTLTIQKAHKFIGEEQALRNAFNEIERSAGVKDVTFGKHLPDNVPTNGGGGNYYVTDDYGVLATELELQRSYRSGELPLWIQDYAETGKLTTDEEIKDRMRAARHPSQQQVPDNNNDNPAKAKRGIFGFLKPKKDDDRSIVNFGQPGTGVTRSFGDGEVD